MQEIHFKFSLKNLLLGITGAAFLCWAMVIPANDLISYLVLIGCHLAMLIIPLGIVYRAGKQRAFWIGAATLGWGLELVDYLFYDRDLMSMLASEHAQVVLSYFRQYSYQDIHAVMPLIRGSIPVVAALVGGLVGQYFYHSQRRIDAERESGSSEGIT